MAPSNTSFVKAYSESIVDCVTYYTDRLDRYPGFAGLVIPVTNAVARDAAVSRLRETLDDYDFTVTARDAVISTTASKVAMNETSHDLWEDVAWFAGRVPADYFRGVIVVKFCHRRLSKELLYPKGTGAEVDYLEDIAETFNEMCAREEMMGYFN